MAEISAAAVKDLREKTGAGMMECKKALTESNGDFEKAIDLLRQKGLASAAKKASRSASEGLISVKTTASSAVMVEINCETDFVARTDDFRGLIDDICSRLAAAADTGSVTAQIPDLVNEKIAKLGENIVFRRFEKFGFDPETGAVGSYIHMNKIGVMVEAQCASAAVASHDAVRELLKDVAMHIAAANPSYLGREAVPADVIEREKEIYRAQVTNKPAQVVEKIVGGKLEKFYSDVCLLEQIFVKDPDQKKRIKDLVAATGATAGGAISLTRFSRFQLGETQPAEPKSC
ncbi:MAG: translation elongation factor Ts [Thermodesulfovibrionales bacterium]